MGTMTTAEMAMTMPGKAVKFVSKNPFPPNSGVGSLPKMRPMTRTNTGAKAIEKMTAAGSRRVRIAVTLHS